MAYPKVTPITTPEPARMPQSAADFALVVTSSRLDAGHIEAVTGALSSITTDRATILAPDRACEWLLHLPPPSAKEVLETIRTLFADEPIDANVVPAGTTRRKQLLIADMDLTIIEQECIDEIAEFAGHGAEVAAITERAMRGELDFEAALKTRVALLADLPTATLERVIEERLTITKGARQLVATMAANGAYCALVSGGFTFFTTRVAAIVGFQINRANTLAVSNDKLTGAVVPPILGRQAKLDALHEFATSRTLPLEATLAVGDGANDLAMIKAAGLGVAYHAKPIVAAEADAQINHSDLSALLYLQGYHTNEIIC